MNDPKYLTAEGAQRLRAELKELTGPQRDEIAQRLRSAIQMGDLSENADYHKAKEDQAFLEGHIQELEYLLKNAIIIETTQAKREVVEVGATVTIQEEDYPPETYFLVGAKEADPRNGRISNESPIGSALLGARAGEVVTAQTPNGAIQFKIIKVE
ncbi:MAG: transcription elongation factor GreA [Anaerolineales bacterium]|nr:transcription elongation factor GreA [Anaerolineales bacterium]